MTKNSCFKGFFLVLVDFDAIIHNANVVKSSIADKKLCAVVKSNAYGHGITQVAKALDTVADMFAVGSVSEGLELLDIRKDILVLLPCDKHDTLVALNNGFVLTVDSFSTLRRVVECAQLIGVVARIHVKIDSGMGRLGFVENEVDELLNLLRDGNIHVEGVFSHFACADCDVAFTDKQLELFCSIANSIERYLGHCVIKHISNTAATFLDTKYHLDMVRVGLGLYGYGNDRLIPAKTFVANVVSIKKLCAGDSVGYGANYCCCDDTTVAVLDVGYASGFSKSFSDKYIVDIHGNKCRQIGNVCMGMMMVDVTNTDVSVGDIAVLFGKNTYWNKHAFMYEALCNTR